jgi:nicotinamidase-related amidase/type 1 glutamine amidotransferase
MESKRMFAILALLVVVASGLAQGADKIKIVLNARGRAETSEGGFAVVNQKLAWEPSETAVIICDMWDKHWCKGATDRVAEMAPRMNQFIEKARAKGMLIVHAPSGTVDYYKDHPARKRAQEAPQASNLPEGIGNWCRWIDDKEKAAYPIDQSDGGCDCEPKCKGGHPWQKQIRTLEIRGEDAISDSGVEIWNLLEQRGIRNVIILGVHTNMCVLGRPFGLRNMARFGKNVVLVRDLTDTMYNHRMSPYVNHFTGTELIVEHIEKYVCPTVTSAQLMGGPAYRFKNDHRPRVVFVVAENEYDADKTLADFGHELQTNYDFSCEFALGLAKPSSVKERDNIAGMEALATADLAVVYVRRRALPPEQMKYLRDYIKADKPLIGLRTASHAFVVRGDKPEAGFLEWPEFDPEMLGGNYHGHHGNKGHDGPKTYVWVEPGAGSHLILAGVPQGEIHVPSWLYKTLPLSKSATVLMTGRVDDRRPHEPVAWTNTHSGGGRVFYTSLGHPGDFKLAWFRRMLTNAVFWALDRPAPSDSCTGAKMHVME